MIRIERIGAVFTAILLLCSVLSISASARLSRSRQVPNSIQRAKYFSSGMQRALFRPLPPLLRRRVGVKSNCSWNLNRF